MNLANVRGYAGVIGQDELVQPWGDTHFGNYVNTVRRDEVTLWCFSSEIDDNLRSVSATTGKPHNLILNGGERGCKLENALAKADGMFSLCAMTSPEEFTLATDWLGLGQAFYCTRENGFYFSSHLGLILDMIGIVPNYDQLGITSILCGATLLGGRTIYEDIHRLDSGELVNCNIKSLRLHRKKYIEAADVLISSNFDSNQYTSMLDQQISRSIVRESFDPDYVTLMLTGGRDSKAVAYASKKLGLNLNCATFGRRLSSDVVGARRLAKQVDFQHHYISYDNFSSFEHADFISSVSGGMAGMQTALNTLGFQEVKKFSNMAITGFLGDSITGAHLDDNYEQLILSRINDWSVPVKKLYAEELCTLRGEIEALSRFYKDLSSTQRSLLIDLKVRQATHISTQFSMCSWIIDVCSPFCNRDLICFLFNLPREELRKQKLYDEWIADSATLIGEKNKNVYEIYIDAQIYARQRISWRFGVDSGVDAVDWGNVKVKNKKDLTSLKNFCTDDRLMQLYIGELLNIHNSNASHAIFTAASIINAKKRFLL